MRCTLSQRQKTPISVVNGITSQMTTSFSDLHSHDTLFSLNEPDTLIRDNTCQLLTRYGGTEYQLQIAPVKSLKRGGMLGSRPKLLDS